jgi:hypothetical protein
MTAKSIRDDLEPGVSVIPMILSSAVLKFLTEAGMKRGKSVSQLVNEAIGEKIEKMAKEDSKKGDF